MAKIIFRFKGGPGSGHRGHKGRPGKQGGGLPEGISVIIPEGAKSVDISNIYMDFSGYDYHKDSPVIFKNIPKAIERPSAREIQNMMWIAKNEKDFYNLTESTGPDEHVEINLIKFGSRYRLLYSSFHSNVDIVSWVEDFCRCPKCKNVSITPDFEQAYSSCSTCDVEFQIAQ